MGDGETPPAHAWAHYCRAVRGTPQAAPDTPLDRPPPGLIDAAYRGEIKVILLNTDPEHDYHVQRGERIAQLVLQRVEEVVWQVVESLDGEDRGGGFGHSGRH